MNNDYNDSSPMKLKNHILASSDQKPTQASSTVVMSQLSGGNLTDQNQEARKLLNLSNSAVANKPPAR